VPYDKQLAERVRAILADRGDVTERNMFGGIAFMVGGHMCCGVNGSDLVLRLGEAQAAAAFEHPETRPMDFTGRPMKGFVYVSPEGTRSPDDLHAWVVRAADHVGTLPPKG
jgi:TfoX/Sxy family transcriptional regulator of competence genes